MWQAVRSPALLTVAVVAVAAVGCSKTNNATMGETGAAPAATPAPAPESAATAPAGSTSVAPGAMGATATGATTVEQNAFQPAPGAPSGISGSAVVLKLPNDSTSWKLAVNLTGLPAGEHAWHIHNGSCSQPNAPVLLPLSPVPGQKAIDGNLKANAQGMADDTVTVPDARLNPSELNQNKLSLHVHAKGGANHGATIACAAM